MMDERCDVAIIALVIVVAICLAVFYLKVPQPTGGLVAILFPQL